MLGDFHTAKFVEQCIGKYIQGSWIEENLGRHRYLVLILTLSFTQGLPYFSQSNRKVKMGDFLKHIVKKNPEESKSSYQCLVIKQEFEQTFSRGKFLMKTNAR